MQGSCNTKQKQHKGPPCSSASPRTATEAWLQSAAQKKPRRLEKAQKRFRDTQPEKGLEMVPEGSKRLGPPETQKRLGRNQKEPRRCLRFRKGWKKPRRRGPSPEAWEEFQKPRKDPKRPQAQKTRPEAQKLIEKLEKAQKPRKGPKEAEVQKRLGRGPEAQKRPEKVQKPRKARYLKKVGRGPEAQKRPKKTRRGSEAQKRLGRGPEA